jgi:mRNA (guanine-N7-)-methyltransferase
MALEYNLRLLYKKDFEEIFNEEQAVPEFSDLLKRMKVVNDEGSSEMTGDQWEACSQSSVLFLSLSLGVSFS